MLYLCYDSGLYTELANSLSDNGKHKVIYCTPNNNAFPAYKDFAPGLNFLYLDKLDKNGNPLDFFDWDEKAGCIVNFDVSQNDMINRLRKLYPNKSIVGAGLGAKLENDRIGFKKILQSAGLSIGPYEVIEGFKNLVKYLQDNKDVYVKINIFRGDWETIHIADWDSAEQELYQRAVNIGLSLSESIKFIVEKPLKSVIEVGFDGFFNGTEVIQFSQGYEIDKNLYLGKVTRDMCPQVKETMDKLTPFYQKMNYRGLMSTEEKVMSKTEHYFLDPCQRGPLPLGVLYSKYIKNWPEFIYALGKGEYVEPECDFKYVAAYCLSSENAKDGPLFIHTDKKHDEDFRFMMCYQDKKGHYHAVKGNTGVVVIVAAADDPEEAIELLKEKAEYVDAYGLDKDPLKGIGDVMDIIKKGESVGIDF